MDENTARQIAKLTAGTLQERNMMDAIRLLRAESGMGLINAKDFLNATGRVNEEVVYAALIKEFVIDPQERLRMLRIQRDQLDQQIELVEAEIAAACGHPEFTGFTRVEQLMTGDGRVVREIEFRSFGPDPHGLGRIDSVTPVENE